MKDQQNIRRFSERLRIKAQEDPDAYNEKFRSSRTFAVKVRLEAPFPYPTTILYDHGNEAQFTSFPKLPPELRRKIMALALPGPRVVEIFPNEDNRYRGPLSKPTKNKISDHDRDRDRRKANVFVPALLHVNRESRNLALKYYKPFFYNFLVNWHLVFMDCERDTVLLSSEANIEWGRFLLIEKEWKYYDLGFIQKLAMDEFWLQGYEKFKPFKGLKELTALYPDTGSRSPEPKQLAAAWSIEAKKKGGPDHENLGIRFLEVGIFWGKYCLDWL